MLLSWLQARISQVSLAHRTGSYTVFGEADEIDEEKKIEEERLRQLGIARLKREEEERIRMVRCVGSLDGAKRTSGAGYNEHLLPPNGR